MFNFNLNKIGIMRNIIFYTILMILFISCKNKPEEKNVIIVSNDSIVKEQINIGLLKRIEDFREWKKNDRYSIADSNMCYLVKFSHEKEFLDIAIPHDSNPVIVISHNRCDINYTGYKGILKINTYYVAIFDAENIGSRFYDQSSFVDMNISDFKCFKRGRGKNLSKIITGNSIIWIDRSFGAGMSLSKIRGDSIIPSPPPREDSYY